MGINSNMFMNHIRSLVRMDGRKSFARSETKKSLVRWRQGEALCGWMQGKALCDTELCADGYMDSTSPRRLHKMLALEVLERPLGPKTCSRTISALSLEYLRAVSRAPVKTLKKETGSWHDVRHARFPSLFSEFSKAPRR